MIAKKGFLLSWTAVVDLARSWSMVVVARSRALFAFFSAYPQRSRGGTLHGRDDAEP
jgi:hypothetical protein